MRNLFPHATAPFFVIGIGRKPATEMERRSRGIEVGTAEFAIRRVLAFFWELVFDFL